MVLVLGRPGSGCTTFLKTIATQTESYESVQGQILYGGLSAKEMKQSYRGQVVYNPGSLTSLADPRNRRPLRGPDCQADVGFCRENEDPESAP